MSSACVRFLGFVRNFCLVGVTSWRKRRRLVWRVGHGNVAERSAMLAIAGAPGYLPLGADAGAGALGRIPLGVSSARTIGARRLACGQGFEC